MITVEDRGDELYVVDAEKNEVTIAVSDWEPGGSPREIDRRVDRTIAGRVSELRFPEAAVCIESEGQDQWTFFGNDVGPYNIQFGDNLVQVETNVITYISFCGQATVRRIDRGDDVIINFNKQTTVTIGFRSKVQVPLETIVVEPTTKGIAKGISFLSASIETSSPDRSYPSLRGHPPLLEFGESQYIPDKLREDAITTDIEFHVPNNLASIFVVSPLTYYLQASMNICEVDSPYIFIPRTGFKYTFPKIPDLQHDVGDVLRQVFFLDCLVRNSGPYGTNLSELSILDDIPINAEILYDAAPEERLETYLNIPFKEISSELPDWHLSMFLKPELSHATTLPFLLHRLCLIYLPDGTSLSPKDLIKQSLNQSTQSKVLDRWNGSRQVDNPVKPATRAGRTYGWMADGVPIDAFKALPTAFDNRLKYVKNGDGVKTITVVLNEPEMKQEQARVEEIYHTRAQELSINVLIEQELTKAELTDVFESQSDFIHYIGHCDENGLRCTDGDLSINDIRESNARTFFLNACGSYQEGINLIKKGSVAGAVTLQRVLNDQAVQVGTAFARMIIHGFSVERAIKLARYCAVISKAYISIGDGSYTLSQSDDVFPLALEVNEIDQNTSSDMYVISANSISLTHPGSTYQPYLEGGENYLFGNKSTFEISKRQLINFLSNANIPTIYDGSYYWSDELIDAIGDRWHRETGI